MPTGLEAILLPYIIQGLGAIGVGIGTIAAIAVPLAAAASYLLLAAGAYLVSSSFQQGKPEAPKPEDGKYNLKQTVPPLVYVLGRVKKAGDYVFLEERAGTAYHVLVHAAHRIQGYVQHYLHDEGTNLGDDNNVIWPGHFFPGGSKVRIYTRLGLNAETAYGTLTAVFPEIWSNDHRGDGLASVMMEVASVKSEDLQTVYPFGMPQHSAIIDGHAEIFDPRTGTYGFSTNLALLRLWHLTHPVGGKLTMDDMYLPDWSFAASVCDQNVINRAGGVEHRYHGGFWFRANNDPVQIGRIMDQAAELVIYERPDGKVGVHAGGYVTPDVRLTADDIVSISYDPNLRRSGQVLAVRGRYTDPAKGFNTADAAIYGDPYPSDDERTKTVDNQAVQKHNHIARLQKIAFIRANAPRVKIVAHYEPAKELPYRRFVSVHYPPRMSEVVVEITGRPTLSLRGLTLEFEGIIVPGAALYAFTAVTEEGVPGANVVPIEREEVPVPVGFNVTIQDEDVGGAPANYGQATFTFQNSEFQYELEWELTSGGPAQQQMGVAGSLSVRSLYLADSTSYRFRARTWSVGAPSAWTSYITRTT